MAAALASDQAIAAARARQGTREAEGQAEGEDGRPEEGQAQAREEAQRTGRRRHRHRRRGDPHGDARRRRASATRARRKPVATPRRVAASPRVVAKRKTTITPQKRKTPAKPAPTSAPAKPAPVVSTPQPESTPAPTPAPTRPGRPGHGNGNGGDDDPGNGDATSARGPGRVNLIGEHTDYNGGLALPFAIDRGVTATAEPLAGDRVEVVAEDLGETDAFPLAGPEPAEGWRAFARGIVAELTAAGVELVPARIAFTGDVPRGAGLSSSAALETALCLALLGVAGAEEPDRIELAKLCSRVENDWVGAETGLLDQLASLLGAEGHALRIDFATLAIEPVPLDLRGLAARHGRLRRRARARRVGLQRAPRRVRGGGERARGRAR